jgi:VanZ family protein
VPVNDKVVHVGLYAVLGAALAFGRASSGTSMSHIGLIVVGALYGASDEWHQMYVPGRFADVFDWIADVVGVSMGYGLWWKLRGGRPSGTTSTDTAT